MLFALWGTDLLVAGLPVSIPRREAIRVDCTVLAFALGLSILTALAFGLAPALRVARRASEALKEASRGNTMGRRGVPTACGPRDCTVRARAGAVSRRRAARCRSFVRILATSPGFQSGQLLALDTSLPRSMYPSAQQVRGFYREMVERARRVPA